MKEWARWFLGAFLFVMMGAFAFASAETEALPGWLELSAGDTVLTARLPIEDAAGHKWRFMISDESVLQLITCEVIGDEEGEPQDGMWVGSFMGTGIKAGSAVLQLTCTGPEGQHIETRMLELDVSGDGAVKVRSAAEDSWYWLDEEQCALHVGLQGNPSAGYSWQAEISDRNVLHLTGEEIVPAESGLTGAPGLWTAVFRGTGGQAGRVTVELKYARPWESAEPHEVRKVELFVNEGGYLQLLAGEEK